jgi:hypothetical protein
MLSCLVFRRRLLSVVVLCFIFHSYLVVSVSFFLGRSYMSHGSALSFELGLMATVLYIFFACIVYALYGYRRSKGRCMWNENSHEPRQTRLSNTNTTTKYSVVSGKTA